MDRNDSSSNEKLLGDSSIDIAEQPSQQPTAFRRHSTRQQPHRSLIEMVVKLVFGAISVFLLVIICVYAGSKTIFDTNDKVESGEKVLVEPKVRDCRTTGCFNDFECVPVAADFACFIPPCPSTVYECQPRAALKDPEDALFSILPVNVAPGQVKEADRLDKAGDADNYTTDLYGKPSQLTEGYYACIQQHNGRRSWRHPTEPCNTCSCNALGGISCTKMLCKPANRPDPVNDVATIYASRLLTTVMTQISAGPGVSRATPQYTSTVIDIQQ
ncbi:hypothetical protein GGI24_004237 [Coemansia furcata]|nr:hypothetical protein GGI24_004237 [Coemansia furcata]